VFVPLRIVIGPMSRNASALPRCRWQISVLEARRLLSRFLSCRHGQAIETACPAIKKATLMTAVAKSSHPIRTCLCAFFYASWLVIAIILRAILDEKELPVKSRRWYFQMQIVFTKNCELGALFSTSDAVCMF
jgi:hypothetical protein